jgi:hypothetical protein
MKAIINIVSKYCEIDHILVVVLFISSIVLLSLKSYYFDEISESQYMTLYIECQQNSRFCDKVKICFDDKKITNSEYKDLIKNVRLSNKQVLSHILSTK